MSSTVSKVPLKSLYTVPGQYTEVFPQHLKPTLEGLVSIGGELTQDLLIEAYSKGIFPWYNNPPIQWFSPEERLVLSLDKLRLSRSFRKWCRTEGTFLKHCADSAFSLVIKACQTVSRKAQEDEGTWINSDMIHAYQKLHHAGLAHSVEIWKQDPNIETPKLVGGLYGVSLGKIFFGESMFSYQTNTSKLALALLCQFLKKHHFILIDCQVVSEHLLSMGAEIIKRQDFIKLLQYSNTQPTLKGLWTQIWRETCGEKIDKFISESF